MSQNLKNQLIKLGSEKPELREHLRPILDKVAKKRKLKWDGKLPKRIKSEMKLWRRGLGDIEEYIEFHKMKAREVLNYMRRRFGVDVKRMGMKRAGNMDGMKVLAADIVTAPAGHEISIVWQDSHGSGYFMKDTGSGKTPLYEEDLNRL